MSFLVPHLTRRPAGGLLLLLGALGAALPVSAAVTDPFGYVAYNIPGGARRLVGVPLIRDGTHSDKVSSVSAQRIALPTPVQASYFGGAATLMVQVRAGTKEGEGVHAGMTFTATGYEGNELILDSSPSGLIAPGDTVALFPNYNLTTLFGPDNTFGLQAGDSAEEADTVSLWNAASQTSRIFYLRTGEGWREAGHEAAGDRGGVTISFPEAIMVKRRSASPLNLVVQGMVPMPLEQRYFHALPGRNLISAPFSMAATVADYGLYQEGGAPFSVIAGDSAPEADTIRFSNSTTATESEIIYYRSGHGWRVAGSGGDASATPVELGQAMDFQRVGNAGFIRVLGIVGPESAPLRVMASSPTPVETPTVPILNLQPGPGSLRIGWSGEAGATYQIQCRPPGAAWQNLGGEVVATEGVTTTVRPVTGGGELRIVKK